MGIGFNSMGMPANYMNNMYWQVINQTLANNMRIMQTYQQNIYNAKMRQMAEMEARQRAEMEARNAAQVQAQVNASTAAQQTTNTQAVNPEVKDGKDDGKISFWEKCKNMGKGAVNMVKGMFCDEKGFSLKRTLTTVAVAAGSAALIAVTGGAATPFLVAAGATMGAVQIGKGAINAAGAKTDAEAAAAWQDIGGGTLAVGLSVAGAKTALKSAGKVPPSGKFSSLKATVECFKDGKQFMHDGWNVIKTPSKYGDVARQAAANWNKSIKGEKVTITREKTQPKTENAATQNKTINIAEEIKLSDMHKESIAKFNKLLDDMIKPDFASNSKATMEANLKFLADYKNSLLERNASLALENTSKAKMDILGNKELISAIDKKIDFASAVYAEKYPTARISANNYPAIVKAENKGLVKYQQPQKNTQVSIVEQPVTKEVITAYATKPLFTKQNMLDYAKIFTANQTQSNVPAQQVEAQVNQTETPVNYNQYAQYTQPQYQYDYSLAQMQPPVGTGLEFQDLYVSPYPEFLF